jgi:hypothetical protein
MRKKYPHHKRVPPRTDPEVIMKPPLKPPFNMLGVAIPFGQPVKEALKAPEPVLTPPVAAKKYEGFNRPKFFSATGKRSMSLSIAHDRAAKWGEPPVLRATLSVSPVESWAPNFRIFTALVSLTADQADKLISALETGARFEAASKAHSVAYENQRFQFRVSGRSEGIFPITPEDAADIAQYYAERKNP